MILALSLLAGVGAALFHPEAALLVNRTQSHEIGNAMGRFAVGGSAGFALGPLIAGGVLCLWRPIPLGVYGYCRARRVAISICVHRSYY